MSLSNFHSLDFGLISTGILLTLFIMRGCHLLALILFRTILQGDGMKLVEVITTGVVTNATGISMHNLGPAFDLAAARFQQVHVRNFTIKHTYLIHADITNCADLASQISFMLSEWYYRNRTNADVYAFVSPVCSEFAEVNLLLTNWDILMIATSTDSTLLRNKTVTPATLSLSPTPFDSIVGMYLATLTYFSWSSIVIVFDQNANTGFHSLLATMVPLLRERNWQVTLLRVASKTSMDFTKELEHFRSISRGLPDPAVYEVDDILQFVIQAQLLGQCTGEYVYIGFNIYKQKALGEVTWKYGDADDTVAKEAFRSVLVVGPDVSVYALANGVSISDLTTGYVSALNVSYPSLDVPPAQVATIMVAFSVLGQILEETLYEKQTEGNFGGRQLAKKVLDRRFDLGYTEITVDAFGQRLIHEELSEMDPITGTFKPALQLQFTRPKTVLQLADIDWGGPANSPNTVPLNEPICGYSGYRGPCSGEFRQLKSSAVAALVTTLSLVFVGSCLVFYFYYDRKSDHTFAHFLITEHEMVRSQKKPESRQHFRRMLPRVYVEDPYSSFCV